MAASMIHLNGDLLCAIDTETTGLEAGFHDIIQIAVVPLGSDYKPLKSLHGKPLMPFYTDLIPKRPENADPVAMRVNGRSLAEIIRTAVEPFKAADMFVEWFEALGLAYKKQIAPLGHNYPFDRGFIVDWLGQSTYESLFSYRIRDSCTAALFLNDLADFRAEPCPYPKYKLSSLCERLNVTLEGAHDALQDARATAEVYRLLLKEAL